MSLSKILIHSKVSSIHPTLYWIFDPRFDFMLDYFIAYLKRHGMPHPKPVQVLSYHRQINKWDTISLGHADKEGSLCVDEPDMVNRRFEEYAGSKGCFEHSNILTVAFTGEGLRVGENRFFLNSAGATAEQLNDKRYQYALCNKYGIHIAPYEAFEDLSCLQARHDDLMDRYGSYVIKFPGFSGGYRMTLIESSSDLERFASQAGGLRQEPLVAAAFVKHRQSISGVGSVYDDGTVCFWGSNEQLLYERFMYMGFIYPAFLDEAQLSQVKDIVMRVGQMLHLERYRGFFNVDFMLVEDGRLIVAEINVRFGFGLLLFGCMHQVQCFDVLLDRAAHTPIEAKGRIVIVKRKGTMGKVYQGLLSHSNLIDFYNGLSDDFESCYCGEEAAQRYVYGSFIGMAGKRFSLQEGHAYVAAQAEKCYLGV